MIITVMKASVDTWNYLNILRRRRMMHDLMLLYDVKNEYDSPQEVTFTLCSSWA